MQTVRALAGLWCLICLVTNGCGEPIEPQGAAGAMDQPGGPVLEVAQVQTVTTVQDSAGLFLSPTPEQEVPGYVEHALETSLVANQEERAKVDLALLFRWNAPVTASRRLEASLLSPTGAPWSPIQHFFPRVSPGVGGVTWPLEVLEADAVDLDESISAEWRGWQGFRGLGVRSSALAGGLSAPVATLDFEMRGPQSPLVLTAVGDNLVVVNRSDQLIEQALLVYSHPGGVAVTVVGVLGPGEGTVTILGPKEHPPDVLLEMARDRLGSFFGSVVGPELGVAMAQAKSIPFLETQGLRLIALLNEDAKPVAVSFSSPVAQSRRVVVSHSEILKPEEEARVLAVVSDASLLARQTPTLLGRFTEAKLEFGASHGDAAARARSATLLAELRAR